MLESSLEKEVVEWAASEGGEAFKLKIDGRRGWPDRTIFLPGARIIIPELKRLTGSTKKYEQQKHRVAWLQSLGFGAGFCTTLDEVKELLNGSTGK